VPRLESTRASRAGRTGAVMGRLKGDLEWSSGVVRQKELRVALAGSTDTRLLGGERRDKDGGDTLEPMQPQTFEQVRPAARRRGGSPWVLRRR
jgi:hypothetical protein